MFLSTVQDRMMIPRGESLSDLDADVGEGDCVRRTRSLERLADVAYDCYLSHSCVYFLHHPSVANLARLRKKLNSDDKQWMVDFLDHHGLELLFECMGEHLGHHASFYNAVLCVECVLCVKACMNSAIGLQCLVTSGQFVPKFAIGND